MDTNDTQQTPEENKAQELITAAAAQLWGDINLLQIKQIQAAEESGDIEQAILSVIGDIAQKAQENTAEHEAQEEQEITVDTTGYDPKLNPASPDFNLAEYKAAINAAGGFNALWEQLKKGVEYMAEDITQSAAEALNSDTYKQAIEESARPVPPLITAMGELSKMAENIANNAMDTMKNSGIQETAQRLAETAKTALSGITIFINSDMYKAVKGNMQAMAKFIEETAAAFAALAEEEEKQNLAPFLQLELEAAKDNPEFADCTIADIFRQGIDEHGNPTESKFKELIERAKQRRAEYKATEETIADIEAAAQELPRIIANPTEKLNYPLDKPNSVIWNLITDAAKNNPNGQIQLAIDTSKKGSKQDAVILYSINFDELPTDIKITKQLTQYDKRVYIAAAGLFNAGNEIISATQVYKMMGNSGTPQASDLQKINDSLTKMGAARVYIDNTQEVQQAKGYKLFKYDAPLLPFERISAYINGQLTASAIHIFREPPLISFAKQRNQITTINRQLLESPISKTDANLLIDDYLLERIGHMKSGKGKAPRKMLFVTIYDHCNIKTAKQRQRAPEKIRRYLEHYKKCGWIKGYKEETDGITILL